MRKAFIGSMVMVCIAVVSATLVQPGHSSERLPQQQKAEADVRRTIKVTARSEIEVDPGEVELIVSIETLDADVLKSKAQNDAITKRVMALAGKYKLKPEQIKTTGFDLGPRLERNSRRLLGYELDRTIQIRFREFDAVETMLSDVVEAGVTRVDDLRFVVSNQREQQFEARKLAVTYAREKATHLAELNGMAVGRPIRIEEGVEYSSDAGGFGGGGFFGASLDRNANPAAGHRFAAFRPTVQDDKLIAPGQVMLQANVTIEFELVAAE